MAISRSLYPYVWSLTVGNAPRGVMGVRLYRLRLPGRPDDREYVGCVNWDHGLPMESLDDFLHVLAAMVDAPWSSEWPWRAAPVGSPWGRWGGIPVLGPGLDGSSRDA